MGRGTNVCSRHLGHMTKMTATRIYGNQRTNGPVNAHLISGPTVSTKTRFAKFERRKIGQGQLRVIICKNFVELEYIMLHAKFQDHTTVSSAEEDF